MLDLLRVQEVGLRSNKTIYLLLGGRLYSDVCRLA
jgi:hypothetical protein